MEIRTKEVTIPSQNYMVREYVAKDGQIFNTEAKCLAHESFIDFKNTPLAKNSIPTYTFYEEYSATLYYINSKEDIKSLIPYCFSYINGVTDFNEHGAGWYICYCIDGGDYADSYYLYHYDTYLNNFKNELSCYEKKNSDAIREIWLNQ